MIVSIPHFHLLQIFTRKKNMKKLKITRLTSCRKVFQRWIEISCLRLHRRLDVSTRETFAQPDGSQHSTTSTGIWSFFCNFICICIYLYLYLYLLVFVFVSTCICICNGNKGIFSYEHKQTSSTQKYIERSNDWKK